MAFSIPWLAVGVALAVYWILYGAQLDRSATGGLTPAALALGAGVAILVAPAGRGLMIVGVVLLLGGLWLVPYLMLQLGYDTSPSYGDLDAGWTGWVILFGSVLAVIASGMAIALGQRERRRAASSLAPQTMG